MTLLQLRYFSTLARMLHYTHAADELNITQPTLSYSMSELEKELGIHLFVKQNRKIILTEDGACFLKYVRKSLALLEEGRKELRKRKEAAGQDAGAQTEAGKQTS